MTPLVITPRKTVDEEVILSGFNFSNTMFKYQENGFITSKLFLEWADQVFLPNITFQRQQTGYVGPIILIMDGLGAHHGNDFLSECENQNIIVQFLVPHSSYLTQPLDLLTFGLFKKYFSSKGFGSYQSANSKQIIEMLSAWYKSTSPNENIKAFERAGIKVCLREEIIFARVVVPSRPFGWSP